MECCLCIKRCRLGLGWQKILELECGMECACNSACGGAAEAGKTREASKLQLNVLK